MPRPRKYRIDDHVPHLMHRAAAAMFVVFSNDFPDGLSLPMWRILAVLNESGEQRQVDLARRTYSDESTTSRVVTSLTRSKLVQRRRSVISTREVRVKLTAKGQEVVERHIPTVLEHEAMLTRGLSAADVRLLRAFLGRIRMNMEAHLTAHPSKHTDSRHGSPVGPTP